MGCTTSRLSSAGDSNEGEIVRKFEYRSQSSNSELDPDSKGTTIIALFYKWGVIVGVDSRSSNEGQYEKPLAIKDGNDKMFEISSRIIAIMFGTVADCSSLRDYVKLECSRQFQKEGESVPYVVQMAYDHLNDLPDKENKEVFGALIAGWDANNGVQVYCIYLWDSRIHCEQLSSANLFTSVGSGVEHAIKIMQSLYNSLMDEDEAVDVVLKALYNATFFDKLTGGPLRVYRVRDDNYKKICSVNALVVRNPVVCSPLDSEPYSLREYERRVLFLVYSTSFAPIYASQLIDHFRDLQGAEVVAAHLVVKKRDFYFHRVVCKSEEDALRIYQYVQCSPPQPFKKDTWSPLKSFLHQPVVLRNGVPVYVNKSSRDLLQLIVNASN